MVKPKVEVYYDKHAHEYDLWYKGPYGKLYDQLTWDNIRKFLPRSKKGVILDVGGGTGIWALPIAKLGYKVVVADISKKMLEVCRRKVKRERLENKILTKKVNVKNMRCFLNNSFDMVLAEGDVLSYCGDYDKAMKEIVRVAKRGAFVIVSVDNRISLCRMYLRLGKFKDIKRMIETGNGFNYSENGEKLFPLHGFTVKELKELYKKHGLKVVRIIGKPVLTWLLPYNERNKILSKKRIYKKILKIEKELSEKLPEIGGHLEIVGIKM